MGGVTLLEKTTPVLTIVFEEKKPKTAFGSPKLQKNLFRSFSKVLKIMLKLYIKFTILKKLAAEKVASKSVKNSGVQILTR